MAISNQTNHRGIRGDNVAIGLRSLRIRSKKATFWFSAGVIFLLISSSAVPAPLYGLYRSEWRFSTFTLTVIFAIYAIFTLGALLIFGSVSDFVGRRPVIAAGLVTGLVACVVFLTANGLVSLLVGRALQGIAVGITTGAAGALLVDLDVDGERAPFVASTMPGVGLALGALGASVIVEYGPAPTRFIWWILVVVFAMATTLLIWIPETGVVRSGVLSSLRPELRIPSGARQTFLIAVPCFIGVWALSGFYLSLGPSLVSHLFKSGNLVWGGVSIFLLTGLGSIAAFFLRHSNASSVMLRGCLTLLAGTVLTCIAVICDVSAIFLLAAAIAGLGWGPAFLGAFRTVVALAPSDDRAGLIASIFTVTYSAFGVPAVIAGSVVSIFGLRATAVAYSLGIGGLMVLAVVSLVSRRSQEAASRRSFLTSFLRERRLKAPTLPPS